MKNNVIALLILVMGLLIIMAISNPDLDDFSTWAAEKVVADAQSPLASVIEEASKPLIKISSNQNNYLFFSIFEVDNNVKYLGIFNNFIALDN